MYTVAVVIPCYNEEKRLCCGEISDFLLSTNAHLTFVNDGSTDNTLLMLQQLKQRFPLQVQVINLKRNLGKAEAVRIGMLTTAYQGNASIVGFMDADLSTPLSEVEHFLENFKADIEFVFGSRIAKIRSVIKRAVYRHIIGRVIATFISMYLKIPVYDSQCGAKFFNNDLAIEIFREPFVSRWLFDVEIFKRIKLAGKEIEECSLELPLNVWLEKGKSKLNLYEIIKLPFEAWRIARQYKGSKIITISPTPISEIVPQTLIEE
ncbi:MAG: glycosyltransferase [Sediminibacterium magnilacihabitans]|jgi:dolichyl-phosphate beta-glucosyltransferase|nr:glycosyltransferase [Sediminibacterium magnilacihabitans]PQV59465.1 glycosyl transferase family 2 [Sediminibacterium magnilacihabitans]